MPSVFDPTKAKQRLTYSQNATFYALAVDPAAGRIYAGGDDYAIHVFDPSSPKKQSVAQWNNHDNYVSALAVVPDGSRRIVVSGSYDRRLIWWDAATGKAIRTVEAHEGWVRNLAVVPGAGRIVSVGDDLLVKVWETDSARLLHTMAGHAKQTPQGHVTALYALAVSPDGRHAASGDRIGAVHVWDLSTGKLKQSFQVPTLYTYDPRQRKRSIGGIRTLAFSPDGNYLAAGGIGQVGNVDGLSGPVHVEVWDWRLPRPCFTAGAQDHKGIVNQLQFHPSGSWLIGVGGGGDNGFLAFWKSDGLLPGQKDKKDSVTVHRVKTDGHIHSCQLDPSKNELYTAGYHKVEVWSLAATA
jgi:WD40 repeat protein